MSKIECLHFPDLNGLKRLKSKTVVIFRSGESGDSLVTGSTPFTYPRHPTSLRRGLISLFDTVTICVHSLQEKIVDEHNYHANIRVSNT